MGMNVDEPAGRPSLTVALATVLLIAVGAPPTGAAGVPPEKQREKIRFDIPAASLEEALTTFGMQSRLQISFAPELVEEKRSPGLSGRFTAAAGLDELLRDSKLEYAFLNGSTVFLRHAQPTSAPPSPPTGVLTGQVTTYRSTSDL